MAGLNIRLQSSPQYAPDPQGLAYAATLDGNAAAGLRGHEGHLAVGNQTGIGGRSWAGRWVRTPPQAFKGGAILSLFAPGDAKRRSQADWLIAATEQSLFSPAFAPLLAKQARTRQGVRPRAGRAV